MAAKKPLALLTPIEPFFWGQRFVAVGEVVSPDDPVVKDREHLFKPIEVEQATAAPGETRNVTIPKKTSRKKAPAKKGAAE